MKYCKNCGKILEHDNEKCFCRKKGEIIKKVPEDMLFEELKKEIELM